MPLPATPILIAALISPVAAAVPGIAQATPAPAVPATPPAMPGREEDARVATIAYRLALAGVARCAVPAPLTGLVLQHLSQFHAADRPGIIATLALDRGPAVIAIVPGSPAADAGLRPGDVLLAVDALPLLPDSVALAAFDATLARAHADAVLDRVERPGTYRLALLRDGRAVATTLTTRLGCPSRVHLARSNQRNAFADGKHVFLTTGLFGTLRSDDERAFILAHEMAHNILGHAAVMRSSAVKRGLGRALGHSGAIVRGTERDADALAATLMLDAGFDPVAGAQLLRRLDTDLGLALFAAHDGAGTRIAAIRAIVAARTPR